MERKSHRWNFFPALTSWGLKNPWEVMALYLPLGFLATILSLFSHPRPLKQILWILLAGLFLWTFLEYLLHRFIFHPSSKKTWRGTIAESHLEHHRTAHTGENILVRPFFSLALAGIVFLVLSLLTFSFSLAALLESGIFLGYIGYEWVHFMAHRYHPSSPWGRFLKNYHLHHHFKEPSRLFGVTTPLWDFIFRTLPSSPLSAK